MQVAHVESQAVHVLAAASSIVVKSVGQEPTQVPPKLKKLAPHSIQLSTVSSHLRQLPVHCSHTEVLVLAT